MQKKISVLQNLEIMFSWTKKHTHISWFQTFAVFCMLYVFFWIISHTRPRPLCGLLPLHYLLCNRTHPYAVTLLTIGFSSQTFSCWLPKLFSNLVILHLPAYEDGTECSETSVYKIQTLGNYPKENIQHTYIYPNPTPPIYIYIYITFIYSAHSLL